MNDKIKAHHLERKAILYVRQSSTYRVSNNLESQKLQYAMQQRLRYLGWHEIDIVDDDLGRSAAGTVTRAGFERMVAEICLGQVGAVAAREVSRFRTQQSRMATARRGVPGGRHSPDRSRNGVYAAAK
jgi:DNA invertase Pin-like site-specific DNA recombinase